MLSADKLRFLRIENHVTQSEMAEWCDVSTRFVGMIEHGDDDPSEEVYNAWVNRCYGIGKPLAKRSIAEKRATTKKKTTETKK